LVHPCNQRHPSLLSSTSSEGLGNNQRRSAYSKPAFNVPPSVTAAADDPEATISNDECALNPVNQGTANSISNFSQITGDEPASELTRDCLWKNSYTRCSVAIPVTGSSTSATRTYAKYSPASPISRRTDQSGSFSKDVNSDDPNDDDYVHIDIDDGLSDMETQPHPTKRRRIGAFTSQKRYAAQSIISATRQTQSDNQSQVTNSRDPETISIQGWFTRMVSLGRIEYYCRFTEDRGQSTHFESNIAIPSLNHTHDQPQTSLSNIETVPIQGLFTAASRSRTAYTCSFTVGDPLFKPKPVTRTESDFRNDAGDTKYDKSSSSAKTLTHNSFKGRQFSSQDDHLIVTLKSKGLSWSDIAKRFPGRTKSSLQVRYSTKLNPRKFESGEKRPDRPKILSSRSALDSDSESRSVECAAPSQRYGPPRSRCAMNRYSLR
jgi:hypothetical protein